MEAQKLSSEPIHNKNEFNLFVILRSYEKILNKYNIKPENDLFYYKILLQLNLDTEKDWFVKFDKLKEHHWMYYF